MKSNLKTSGIYAIKNIVNGKRYIGSAVHLRKRRTRHFGNLRKGTHKNIILQNAWNKYGYGSFEFNILEYCSKDMLLEREQQYIDEKSDYNICSVAGNTSGVKHTEGAKTKMSKAHSGKILSAEHRIHISEATKGENNPNFGRKHTPEALAKISLASIGRATFSGKKHTEEAKKRMSDWHTGKVLSDETCKKMSTSHKDVPLSETHRNRISNALSGRKLSAEHRENLRIAALNRKYRKTPEDVECK